MVVIFLAIKVMAWAWWWRHVFRWENFGYPQLAHRTALAQSHPSSCSSISWYVKCQNTPSLETNDIYCQLGNQIPLEHMHRLGFSPQAIGERLSRYLPTKHRDTSIFGIFDSPDPPIKPKKGVRLSLRSWPATWKPALLKEPWIREIPRQAQAHTEALGFGDTRFVFAIWADLWSLYTVTIGFDKPLILQTKDKCQVWNPPKTSNMCSCRR